jgi:predicted 2-oxoglutarate/Fe(II)-dependent dioxygenase YbiX
VLVLDRNLRVAMRLQPADGADVAAACLECLDRLPREEPRDISQPAPVILLPNLLPLDVCRSLIERFESSPTIDGEVARIDAAGNVRSVVDHAKKSRRDLPIGVEDERHGWLGEALLHRVAPEIAKAFQARVAHCDRILVCRYDRSAGWFRRHRDNAAANTAFREFALSLNLNSGDYEGGHLLFPEYNDHCYRPPAGAGVVFSAALLHEVAPVTAGQRYVLLTFFHGDAAEARRLAYFARAVSPPTGLTPAPPPPLRS